MRRRLFLVTLGVTTLLVAAFAVPLGLLVRDVARDRAITDAERDVGALVPILTAEADPHLLEEAVERTTAGTDGRMSLWLPDGTLLGDASPVDPDDLELAGVRNVAFSRSTDAGVEVFTPIAVGPDQVAVVRVRIPTALLRDGVATSWMILAVLAAVLLIVAVAVTDRLARSVTRPAADLATTSRALARGEVHARAQVAGPPEIAAVGTALNVLADRIDELLAAERERVADLSHRLRTPLTALRLDAESSGSEALIADVDRLEAEVSELIRSARRPLHEAVVVRCDLAAVARERCAFWGALADDDGRSWSIAGADVDPQPVRLDQAHAAAAIDVLLGNVFAHTPDGSPYAVSVERHRDRVLLIVDDGGPGVADPAVLERGASAAGSTGLGLDIARSAAQAAGGELHIGASPLGGARVVVDLPVVEDSP